MANWNPGDIRNQFKRSQKSGWLPFFQSAANDYQFEESLLMAVASRETNIKNIVGDGGHGYGIMQIDDRSFPDWCHSGAWKDAEQAIIKGASVLDDKRTFVEKNQGKKITFGKKYSFVGKDHLTAGEILRIAVSSYNCGVWAYYNVSQGKDVDATSTGKDYSADVKRRQDAFAEYL